MHYWKLWRSKQGRWLTCLCWMLDVAVAATASWGDWVGRITPVTTVAEVWGSDCSWVSSAWRLRLSDSAHDRRLHSWSHSATCRSTSLHRAWTRSRSSPSSRSRSALCCRVSSSFDTKRERSRINSSATWQITKSHTYTHPFYGPLWFCPGLPDEPEPERYNQEGKINLDLLEQEIVNGSGISWAICKSAPWLKHITMPASHHSVFTGPMPFLQPNQQRQSTEGKYTIRWRTTSPTSETYRYVEHAYFHHKLQNAQRLHKLMWRISQE